MANVAMLEDVLGAIKMNPEGHDQQSWRAERAECGTTMCFAGWAVHLAGGKFFRFYADQEFFTDVVMPGRLPEEIDVAAGRILGLSRHQVDQLFYDALSLDEVEDVVKGIANGEIL